MFVRNIYLAVNRSSGIGKRSLRRLSNGIIEIKEEVRNAVESRKAVVALESTIITHGMRYPHNLETALEVENIIRDEGATPATIAVINGKMKVGLEMEDLEMLAKNQDKTYKISRRDIPYVISRKCTGGTTVSGTMLIAHKAGIPIFVTGGIGGVHRNGENSMDVSADLTELGRTPVAVISAGIKSILDIGRTLEYLETKGVAVASYGPTNDFPAFYARKSGFTVPHRLESATEAAEFVNALLTSRLGSGALIAVPIPESDSFDAEEIEDAINRGLEECERRNVIGKDVTPFLLEHISATTAGRSLKSNIALIRNNCKIGGRISVELSKLRESITRSRSIDTRLIDSPGDANFPIVVIGASNLDNVIRVESEIKEYSPGENSINNKWTTVSS